MSQYGPITLSCGTNAAEPVVHSTYLTVDTTGSNLQGTSHGMPTRPLSNNTALIPSLLSMSLVPPCSTRSFPELHGWLTTPTAGLGAAMELSVHLASLHSDYLDWHDGHLPRQAVGVAQFLVQPPQTPQPPVQLPHSPQTLHPTTMPSPALTTTTTTRGQYWPVGGRVNPHNLHTHPSLTLPCQDSTMAPL
jgi:hypothetical protein